MAGEQGQGAMEGIFAWIAGAPMMPEWVLPPSAHESGRSIEVVELHQGFTYAGLLSGVPDEEMNARIVRERVERASRMLWQHGLAIPVHVIDPPTCSIHELLARLEPKVEVAGWPDGTAMPRIACAAHCRSKPVAAGEMFSELAFVWFQQQAAPPIADDALRGIRTAPWDRLARDASW